MLIGTVGGDDCVWDYSCDCGFQYRVAASEQGAQFWPSNGPNRFSPHSVRAGGQCINCAEQLTLNRREIHDSAPRHAFATESVEPIRLHPVRSIDRDGESTHVALQGEIDLYNAADVRSALARECALGPKRLVVDLTAVDFLDSTALHALQSARKELPDGRGFVVVAPTPAVRRVLEYSGLDRVLTVHTSPGAPPNQAA